MPGTPAFQAKRQSPSGVVDRPWKVRGGENEKVAVMRFIDDVPNVAEPRALLIEAYLRPDPDSKSRVEDAYATARRLTVHFPNRPGELARMLRTAPDVEARIFSDDESTLVYLWPQDVMERVLWPPRRGRPISSSRTS